MQRIPAFETGGYRAEPAFHASDTSWTAVAERDARWDGRFVYAVRTTGIYCRPSCPARRPHRHNVTLFATTGDAIAARYRACRRCRPQDHAYGELAR